MSENEKGASNEANDPKVKFREALEKKKNFGGVRDNHIVGNSKIGGGQTSGNAPKMFRRKSGSA